MAQQGRIFILALVWTLIWGQFILFHYTWIWPNLYSFSTLLLLLFFYPIFALLVISYYSSITTCAGRPPKLQQQYLLDGALQDLKKKTVEYKRLKDQRRHNPSLPKLDQISQLKELTYCFKCENVKPVRAHHCSVCNACVLRMDHHCPWVGNCVGLKNHKLFVQFLLYATTDLSLIWMRMGLTLLTAQQIQIEILYIITLVMGLGLSISIGFLWVSQMFNFYRGITTLESFTQGMHNSGIFDRGGLLENLDEVMGTGHWWSPLHPL